ncbi:MAG: hypothetical protein OEU33_13695 [Chromatiales bacterium]|jgi:hypothetical protein|nr:hypothetical protein [Chromatiales bacterium]
MRNTGLLLTLGIGLLCLGSANAGVILDSAIWDVNGHEYVLVEFDCIQTDCDASEQTWDSAVADLDSTLGDGFRLASITSAEENDFIRALIDGFGWDVWAGAFQDPIDEPVADANWVWVTDEAFDFTNWCDGEPNDAGQPGFEQHMSLVGGGACWNDEGSAISAVGGYVAETFDAAAVSEPSPLLLSILGLFALAVARRTS